jgi:hypothetical protein
MEVPGISIQKVEKLQLAIKDGKTKVTFEASLETSDFARLVNFSRQGRPLAVMISSPQGARIESYYR